MSRFKARRRLISRFLIAIVAIALLGQIESIAPAGASPGTVSLNASTIASPMEYFTNQWNDPMDFSDAADLDVDPGHMVPSGSASMANGILNMTGVGQIFLIRHDPGSIPTSTTRDPLIRPLNADVFSRMSFRMYSNTTGVAAVGFRSCDICADGHRYFSVQAGWHSYDFDMKGGYDTDPSPYPTTLDGPPWTGNISLLYLALPPANATQLDDVRFYRPSPVVTAQLAGGTGQVELWADYDNNQGNDGDGSNVGATADRIGTYPAGTAVQISAGLLWPDRPARFYTVQSGTRSGETGVLTMPPTSSPTPVVTSPNESGGLNFATEIRGDAWDFNEASDAWALNVNASVHDGQLYTTPGATSKSDPFVLMNLGGRMIDATVYDKLQVTITYQGPFGLADAPGGGMVSRVIWRGSDGATEEVSLPIIMETGTHTYTIRLSPNPQSGVLDPSTRVPAPWGTGVSTFIDMLRFDPHEDPGGRTFQIDDVKLLSDDLVRPTTTIHFQDNTWAPGTTTNLYADTDSDRSNGLGTLIAANVPVHAGDNTYVWDGSGVGQGRYWINADMGRAGVVVAATSTGTAAVGMNGVGVPPATFTPGTQPPAAAPNQLQLFYFYVYLSQVKFFCGVARARGITAISNQHICVLLIGPAPKAKKKR